MPRRPSQEPKQLLFSVPTLDTTGWRLVQKPVSFGSLSFELRYPLLAEARRIGRRSAHIEVFLDNEHLVLFAYCQDPTSNAAAELWQCCSEVQICTLRAAMAARGWKIFNWYVIDIISFRHIFIATLHRIANPATHG